MFMNFNKIIDALVCGKRITKRWLTEEVASARESYRSFQICCSGLVREGDSSAICPTKVSDKCALVRTLFSKRDLTEASKWIERTDQPLNGENTSILIHKCLVIFPSEERITL